jgi:tripartite-type tricarboxylate transporter receptor subunit TctC
MTAEFSRRHVVSAITAISIFVTGLLSAFPLAAQTFPSKPVRIVIPFTAGTTTDNMIRVLAKPLSEQLGQPVVVENKAGGDGIVGALEVLKSPADGHTLFIGTNSPMSAVPHLQKTPPYDPLKDFAPLTYLGNYTFFVIVHPDLPVKSIAELIAYAKANPGKVNYASGNTSGIIAAETIASLSGIQFTHVPYKSEPPAIIDLLAGRTQMIVSSYATIAPHVKEGKLRALATTLAERSPLMPDVPTLVEAGIPKFKVMSWVGIFAHAGTPKDIQARLNTELVKAIKTKDVQDQMAKLAVTPKTSSQDELARHTAEQLAIWGVAIKAAGIKPE